MRSVRDSPLQAEAQTARDSVLKRKEKEADRTGRQLAKNHLMEARQLVEQALGAARGAADDAGAREARRMVEEGIREQGEEAEKTERTEKDRGETEEIAVGDRVGWPAVVQGRSSRPEPTAKSWWPWAR